MVLDIFWAGRLLAWYEDMVGENEENTSEDEDDASSSATGASLH